MANSRPDILTALATYSGSSGSGVSGSGSGMWLGTNYGSSSSSSSSSSSGSGSSSETISTQPNKMGSSSSPSPAYTSPNTTTISFEPQSSSTTVITFTQSPSLSYVKSLIGSPVSDSSGSSGSSSSSGSGSGIDTLNTSVIGSPTTQPYTFTSNSSTVMNPNLLNAYGSSSKTQVSSVYPNTSNYSGAYNYYGDNATTQPTNKMSNIWGGTTPFRYETANDTSTTSTQSATQTTGLMESFMNSFFKNNSRKEGLETLSPPPNTPSAFMPKSEAVPPVSPSIPPVIIKQKCDPCPACAPCKNAPTNLPPPNAQGVTYDNLPMPNLPSFKGFGM